MIITAQIGWNDGHNELATITANSVAEILTMAAMTEPGVFNNAPSVDRPRLTLRAMDIVPFGSLLEAIKHVDEVNGEGNYHEFVFRIIDIRERQ